MIVCYVGYDGREDMAYHVCVKTLVKHASVPVRVYQLREDVLRSQGLYWRTHVIPHRDDGDLRPFSTEFAFSRFLVPTLMKWKGWALFFDLDFMWRADVKELFDLRDDRYAVMVVKHDFQPTEEIKMDGVKQTVYPRKNWSSLMLWNCQHPANYKIELHDVNTQSGTWLHGFHWLDDDLIGSLPEEWNHLVGHSRTINPKAVHFTSGGPWMPGYYHVEFADEWFDECR